MRESSRFMAFFFQAEDGIRDLTVTGVQTCALPISAPLSGKSRDANSLTRSGGRLIAPGRRSEERRVGKECRSRRGSHQEQKNIYQERVRYERGRTLSACPSAVAVQSPLSR